MTRWWVIAFVVLAILWWLGHRHLNRRLQKLAAKGALGPAAKAAGCGCSGVPTVGTMGSSISSNVNNGVSQTSGGNQISPAPIGTLPSSVSSAGPSALPKWNPNGGIWQ